MAPREAPQSQAQAAGQGPPRSGPEEREAEKAAGVQQPRAGPGAQEQAGDVVKSHDCCGQPESGGDGDRDGTGRGDTARGSQRHLGGVWARVTGQTLQGPHPASGLLGAGQ